MTEEKKTENKETKQRDEDADELPQTLQMSPSEDTRILTTSGHASTNDDEGPSLWLITFTDIMALMLTFFVLLYSMSVPEEEKWEDISNSVTKGFSKFYSPQYFQGPQDALSIEKLDLSEALDLQYLQTLLEKVISNDEGLKDIVIIPQDNRLIISLPQDLLFEVGKDEVSVRGQKALFALGGSMARIRNRIEIVGHTDPRPVSEGNTNGFSSNWGLSLSRAAQVSNILQQVGYRRNIIVRGISSARYDELPATMDEEQRLDLARRVDIVVMSDDGSTRGFLEFGTPQ